MASRPGTASLCLTVSCCSGSGSCLLQEETTRLTVWQPHEPWPSPGAAWASFKLMWPGAAWNSLPCSPQSFAPTPIASKFSSVHTGQVRVDMDKLPHGKQEITVPHPHQFSPAPRAPLCQVKHLLKPQSSCRQGKG